MSPTANTSSSKPAAAKTARARKAGATTAKAAATKRTSAARKPATATTRRPGAATSRNGASTGTIETVGSYAERAVLIPVGAALIARDRLIAGVNELPRDPSTANAKAQAQLRKFERRGNSARNSLEREARRTRVRLERELRRRRGDVDRAVSEFDKRRSSISRGLTGHVEEASTQIERTVQARVKDAASIAEKVQDRFLNLV
jgi:hypothetical protein